MIRITLNRYLHQDILVKYLLFFFICFVVRATRASPVGIPQDIYRICFYINV
jgi:hypothetical protein